MNGTRLKVRPAFVQTADHVRADVFPCNLASHVEWHLRQRPASMLFEDHDHEGASATRASPVQKAHVSDSAERKADTRITPDGLPVNSMRTMLDRFESLTLDQIALA